MHRRHFVFAAPAAVAALSGLPLRASAATQPVIKFGQSASLTGGQASYGRDVRDGILAAFAAASKADGARGPRFELVTLDDGGRRERCVENAQSLIGGGVAALIGFTNGAAAEFCLPAVSQNQMALLGTASGNMGLRNSNASAAFHVRAGYDLEYRRMAAYVRDFGMRRIGYVFLQDTSIANKNVMTESLAALSVTPKVSIGVDRNAASYDDVAHELAEAKLDCVLFSANANPAMRLMDAMAATEYRGLFYASSYAGQDLVETLTAKKRSCIMSMVVPRPSARGLNVVEKCQEDVAALGGTARMGITTLEGYIAGRIAVEAARNALKAGNGERIVRGRMREAIAGLSVDLGGYKVDFNSGGTQGSQYVDLIAVDRYGRLVG